MKNLLKKSLAVFIALLLLASLPVFSSANEEATQPTDELVYDEAKMGDIDNNGLINASDARILLRCAVELEETTGYILLYGDFDKNNEINADDARIILRIAVRLDSVKCILHGHENYDVIKAPTCTSEGYTQKFCLNCSYTDNVQFDIAPFSGHSIVNETTAASCTEDSVFTAVCSVCGFVAASEVLERAYGHDFGIWQLQGEIKTRVCTRCSYAEAAPNVRTIYLTFDDGPGAYTEKLLRYLREYNVKATFFVTNQLPAYRHLLKAIVDDGHAIAVHSLTHQWSIYSSQTSYLNDFNAMHSIILEDTGVDTKIFRFPGGTNNTVRKNISMSAMAKYMTDAGYVYFDWNVDSGDTKGYSSSTIAENTIAQIKKHHISVVLMHDLKNSTVEAIRTIIRYGLNNGYEFAVLDKSTPRVQFSPAN